MTDKKASTEPLSTIHLAARGCSGRAVRYRILTPDMVGHIESQVSHSLDKDATTYDFQRKVVAMALEQMVVEVTEPDTSPVRYAGKPAKEGDPPPKALEWRKVSPDELHNGWETFFNAKDTSMLQRIYSIEHTVDGAEVDAILAGKVTTVAP